ncbi:stalk domain-containing protein [Paenibacillus koleovorans]|uniref:stalk domain-containing protein n=1 Tax=Paenibacillus koleovorans TaxID=121608 RepID=UPI0013E34744|nr:stalk domain-containing protein [Paenibacillus koleovorans]
MKRALFAFLFVLIFGNALPTITMADADKPITVKINNRKVNFEVQPFIENGVTLVPFRPVFERIGLEVEWDAEHGRVLGTRIGNRIELTIGSQMAYVNGYEKKLEVAPRIVDGTTFVPLRFVGEAADQHVQWYGESSTVSIFSSELGELLRVLNSGEVTYVTDTSSGEGIPADGRGMLYDGGGYLIYHGEFKDSALEGTGSMYLNGVKRYEGGWVNNRFEGKGTLMYGENMIAYEGDFRNGRREGVGKNYSNGKVVYEGQFKNDEINGFGKMYDTNGVMHEGKFDSSYLEYGKVLNLETDYTKKQLEDLHNKHPWNVITTKHTQIYSYEGEEVVKEASARLDEIYDQIVSIYGHLPIFERGDGKVPVYFLSRNDFMSDLKTKDFGGLNYEERIYLNLGSDPSKANLSQILRSFAHELTHMVTLHSEDTLLDRMPAWYSEGVASLHEKDTTGFTGLDYMDSEMNNAARTYRLLSWQFLTASSYEWGWRVNLGYAQSRSIVEYLSHIYGEANIRSLFYKEGNFAKLMREITNKSLKELEADWKAYVLNESFQSLVQSTASCNQNPSGTGSRTLMDNGSSYNLFSAIYSQRVQLVKRFIQCRENVNQVNLQGESPLMAVATSINEPDIAQVIFDDLMKAGANPEYRDQLGVNAYLVAAGYLNSILANRLRPYSTISDQAMAELYMNMKTLSEVEFEKLIRTEGVNLNQEFPPMLTTLLSRAISSGQPNFVKLLLEHGVSSTKKIGVDEGGLLPLDQAVQNGNISVVEVLLNHGADVNERFDFSSTQNKTVLLTAVWRRNLDMIEYLLVHGAEANVHYFTEGQPRSIMEGLDPNNELDQKIRLLLVTNGYQEE